MRKLITSLVLIFSLIMPVMLQLGILFYHKNEIKKEIKDLYRDGENYEDLVLMTFTEEEMNTSLDWEHEWEFEYKGQMYDVVHRKKDGNNHQLWCYKDHKEKKIKDKITRFLAFGFDNEMQKKDNQKKLSRFFFNLFFQDSEIKITQTQTYFTLLFPESIQLKDSDIAPIEPPPKLS